MNLSASELKYRISIGLDFLAQSYKNDQFFISSDNKIKQYNYTAHLSCLSLLLSGSNFLDRPKIFKQAKQIFENTIEKNTFSVSNSKFLIKDNQSLTVWNSLAAVISKKLGKLDLCVQYVNSVIESFDQAGNIHGSYPLNKTQHTHIMKIKRGYPIIALLNAYEITNDGKYLHWINQIANFVTRQLTSDSIEALSLYLIKPILATANIEEYISKLSDKINETSISSMNSLVLAIANQINIANNIYNGNIINLQKTFQIMDQKSKYFGGFIHNSRNNSLRIDYSILSIWSFVQFLLTSKSLDATLVV